MPAAYLGNGFVVALPLTMKAHRRRIQDLVIRAFR
jgi:hypothetical protein